jgi:hypothetical protein
VMLLLGLISRSITPSRAGVHLTVDLRPPYSQDRILAVSAWRRSHSCDGVLTTGSGSVTPG